MTRFVVACMLGGLVGGALVGLGEVALILSTSAEPEEYWLVPYAVVSYGLFGSTLALAGALVRAVSGRERSSSVRGFSFGVGIAVAVLSVIVGRYHIIQRVFHEELILVSPVGVAVHVGLCVGGVVLAWLVARMGRILYAGVAVWGVLAILVLALAGSVGLALATSRPEGAGSSVQPKATASGPNVIFIVTDTLRADALTTYGGASGQTPHLDAFARDGVLFEQAYSQASWTRPSIASLLTSLYPSVHGAIHKMDMLPDRVLTLAEAFSAAGYWSAGLVTNINVAPIFNFQQGFGEYHYLPPDFYFWATDSSTRLAIYKGLRAVRERFGADRMYFYNYYQDARVVDDNVTAWIEQSPPQPFFLFIHYMDPHDPFFEIPYDGRAVARASTPEPPVARRDEMHRLYLEDVSYLDAHLGALFDRLRTRGLYDNSVIAVVADHGEEFQEHGGWWHGTTLYDEQVHVPLIVKRAHEPTPGLRRTDPVRTIDVAPALMVAAGVRQPQAFMGHDLFRDGPDQWPVYAEEDLEGNVLTSLRVGDWKVITANPGNPRGLRPVELYEVSSDPHERNDRAANEPERTSALLQQLAAARARIATGHALQPIEGLANAADRRS